MQKERREREKKEKFIRIVRLNGNECKGQFPAVGEQYSTADI